MTRRRRKKIGCTGADAHIAADCEMADSLVAYKVNSVSSQCCDLEILSSFEVGKLVNDLDILLEVRLEEFLCNHFFGRSLGFFAFDYH
jgi:hypothetical protein